jgi:LPXTG-motif cell wall-anchored protein
MTLGKAFAIGLVLSLSACGSDDAGKMKKIRDEVCACKDMDCVKKVEKENEEFQKSMMAKFKDAKGPEDIPKDLLEIGNEIKECRRKIRREERDSKKDDDRPSMKKSKSDEPKAEEKKAEEKKELPETGGSGTASLLALGAGALLVAGGLLTRRLAR